MNYAPTTAVPGLCQDEEELLIHIYIYIHIHIHTHMYHYYHHCHNDTMFPAEASARELHPDTLSSKTAPHPQPQLILPVCFPMHVNRFIYICIYIYIW